MKKIIAAQALVLLFVILLLPTSVIASGGHSRAISTSGGNRNVTWVEIDLSDNYIVKGLTAQDLFGREAATLSEFAAAMERYMGDDTIIFAPNFHVTATREIVGGVFSQGRVVSSYPQPWLNFGAGFTADNRFSFFSGRFSGGHIYGENWDDGRLDFVTAFNTYPHLIGNGQRLPLVPIAGITQTFLDNRVLRAFMGQRADGTFIIGNVTGASMREVQDVAAYFNLVNATNIDGGASAGIWRNGTYITRPGRQLPVVMFITGNPTGQATQTQQAPPAIQAQAPISVVVNNTPLVMDAPPLLIEGRTLVPVRAIADALNADVSWDSATRAATLYHPNGNRAVMTIDSAQVTIINANGNTSTIGLDVPAMISEGRTLVPLRFFADFFGADVQWIGDTRTVSINTAV